MSDHSDEQIAPRLQEFAASVDELGVTGGAANPERTGMRVGLTLAVIGLVIAVLGLLMRRGDIAAGDPTPLLEEIVRSSNGLIFVVFGLSLALLGGLVWLRNSLTRYLRYWLIRLIYEDRANTDRLISAIQQAPDRTSEN